MAATASHALGDVSGQLWYFSHTVCVDVADLQHKRVKNVVLLLCFYYF